MSPTPVSPPVALSIAGSDCSAGAGLQADLKAFSAAGVYGLTAVTCVVAEVPGHVSHIQPVEADVIAEQVRLLLAAFPVAAIKTGMLWSAETIRFVAETMAALPETTRPWLVVDPVMVATSGDSLIEDDAVAAYREALFPLADLITPNMDEAAALLGRPIREESELPEAARALAERLGAPVLLKGGHLQGETALDVFQPREPTGALGESVTFAAPYYHGVSTHGTGCTYSAAIAAHLARGLPMVEAIAQAKTYITAAIGSICRWGATDALNHSALA